MKKQFCIRGHAVLICGRSKCGKCNECQKQDHSKWVIKNPEKVRARERRAYQRRRDVINIEKDKPCVDCGIKYPPFVMDFDHLPQFEKSFNIAQVIHVHSLPMILEEIKKCEVVCSNCHRIRTHHRGLSVPT